MKTLLILATALLVSACGSAPIVESDDLGYMSRTQVSQAITECESVGQRANVIYTRTKWRTAKVAVPIDVQCSPGPKLQYRWGSAY